jgi:hypothetical protein
MPEKADSKVDVLKGIEEFLIGTVFVFFRMFKTSLIFLVRPRYLVEYLKGNTDQPEGDYILPHHIHIVRPLTYATLCSISFFFISILLVVNIKSGHYGLPTIEMPTINEVTELINQIASKPLSQIILFELPYVTGIVVAGCISRLLLFGARPNFGYLTSLYLCSYFFGVALLLVNFACLCFVAIAYMLTGTGDLNVDILIYVIYTSPVFVGLATLLAYVQLYRYFRQLSELAWWRCIIATTIVTIVFSLSVWVGVSFMGL